MTYGPIAIGVITQANLSESLSTLLSGGRERVSLGNGRMARFVKWRHNQHYDGLVAVCGGAEFLTLLSQLKQRPLAWVNYDMGTNHEETGPILKSISQQGVHVVSSAVQPDTALWMAAAGVSVASFVQRESDKLRATRFKDPVVEDGLEEPLLGRPKEPGIPCCCTQ